MCCMLSSSPTENRSEIVPVQVQDKDATFGFLLRSSGMTTPPMQQPTSLALHDALLILIDAAAPVAKPAAVVDIASCFVHS